MPSTNPFLDFVALMELIVGVASAYRTESLTLRDAAGKPIGRLTVDNGLVRFGIEHLGKIYLDTTFENDVPRLAAVIHKILDRHSLTKAERELIADLSTLARMALLGVTARSLRRMAPAVELPARYQPTADLGLPQLRLLNVAFSPVELLMAAGMWGSPRSDDAAVQLYSTQASEIQDRWLFEWQFSDAEGPWPVMCTHLGIRSIRSVREFTAMVKRLTVHFSERLRRAAPGSKRAVMIRVEDAVCLALSTHRYMAVLTSDLAQAMRIYNILDLIGRDISPRRAEPRTPVSAESRPSAVPTTTAHPTEDRPVPALLSLGMDQAAHETLPAAGSSTTLAPVSESPTPESPIPESPIPESPAAPASPGLESLVPESPAPVSPAAESPTPESPAPESLALAPPQGGATAHGGAEESTPSTAAETPAVTDALLPAAPAAAAPDPATDSSPEPASGEPADVPTVLWDSAAPAAAALAEGVIAIEFAQDLDSPALSDAEAWLEAATTLASPRPAQAAAKEPQQPAPEPPETPPSIPSSEHAKEEENAPRSAVESSPPVAPVAPVVQDPEPADDTLISARIWPSASATEVLTLSEFTARIDGRTILKDVSLTLGTRGVYALMGPGGSGKSSLLGILAGRNTPSSGWTFSGALHLAGAPLGTHIPAEVVPQIVPPAICTVREYLISQKPSPSVQDDVLLASLLVRVQLSSLIDALDRPIPMLQPPLSPSEWIRLTIAARLLSDPPLLCLDEPTAWMEDAAAAPILDVIKLEGLARAVLFVTHNQQHARATSHYTILLAAGQLQERQTTAVFFTAPSSRAAQDYARTGGCYVPSPDASAEALDDAFRFDEPAGELSAQTPAPSAAEELAAPPADPSAASDAAATDTAPAAAARAAQDADSAPGTLADPAQRSQQLQLEQPAVLAESLSTEARVHAEPALQDERTDSVRSSISTETAPPVLSLRDFAVRIGARPAVSVAHLDVAPHGVHLVCSPDGAEKRILMRALSGPRPSSFRLSGLATYLGRPLGDGTGPMAASCAAQQLMLPVQDFLATALESRADLSRNEQRSRLEALLAQAGLARLSEQLNTAVADLGIAERRIIELLRASATSSALILLDEPLVGLAPADCATLSELLRQQAAVRAVLVFAQNPAPFSAIAVSRAFLVEGQLELSERPPAPPVAVPAEPPAAVEPPPARVAPAEPERAPAYPPPAKVGGGPRGFQWLRPGALAGMPAPGITHDLNYDLQLIRDAGISHLVTLTLQPLPAEALSQHGLQSLFLPIEDMDAPTESAAAALCEQVERVLQSGRAVALHCKAGLGRTGTMLAAQLIWEGGSADAALTEIRRVQPEWVQSEKQVKFLHKFADWLRQNKRAQSREIKPSAVAS